MTKLPFRWLCLLVFVLPLGLFAQASYTPPTITTQFCFPNMDRMSFLRTHAIEDEGWHNLPQVKFWNKIIKAEPEISYVNIAYNRWLVDSLPTSYFDNLERIAQRNYKEKMRDEQGLPNGTQLYVTSGKRDYYQLESTLSSIDTAIKIFRRNEVDPWYAQSILLIESPGKLRTSYAGAHGPFQLMPFVARMQGLVVNRRLDERSDLRKSAEAAAKFIRSTCIVETKNMLSRRGISFEENSLWFRLMVLHVYHAGAGNVAGALSSIHAQEGGINLITQLWHAEYNGFGNAAQNYSQVALAALVELEDILSRKCMQDFPRIRTIFPDPIDHIKLPQLSSILPQQAFDHYYTELNW